MVLNISNLIIACSGMYFVLLVGGAMYKFLLLLQGHFTNIMLFLLTFAIILSLATIYAS